MSSTMIISSLLATSLWVQSQASPCAQPGDVSDTYHQVTVADPYRALEDWSDPCVQDWSDAQTAQARAYLDGLALRDTLYEELNSGSGSSAGAPHWSYQFTEQGVFALFYDDEAGATQLRFADRVEGLADAEPIVDLSTVTDAEMVDVEWFKPTVDGSRVAIAISINGSERGDLHVFDVASGTQLGEVIPNVHNPTAGGDLSWDVDGQGFHYTRYPQAFEPLADQSNLHIKLHYHALGRDWREDPMVLGQDLNEIAQIRLISNGRGELTAWVQDGDSGRFAFYRHAEAGHWARYSTFEDGHFQPVYGDGDDLFVLSTADAAMGEVWRLSASQPDWGTAVKIADVREASALVHSYYSHTSPSVVWSGDQLYLRYQIGGPAQIVALDREGHEASEQPLLEPGSSAYGLTATPEGVLYSLSSYRTPVRRVQFSQQTGHSTLNPFGYGSDTRWDDVEIVRQTAASADGVDIPYTMIVREGLGEGPHPVLVYGYGGFRYSMAPRFRPSVRALLDRGVIYVETNLRGGGEYGADWHAQGILTDKQNVFNDFAGVIEALHAQGVSTPQQTAILGESNGGLLMGAMISQHPDLFAAAIAQVGLYDMLRAELDANGTFNIPEYGTVTDADQFAALRAYSPYHNLESGTDYPAILFTTGANDQRVNPMHSRKMTAALQAADSSDDTPVLLYASREGGHGGTGLGDTADGYAFILDVIAPE